MHFKSSNLLLKNNNSQFIKCHVNALVCLKSCSPFFFFFCKVKLSSTFSSMYKQYSDCWPQQLLQNTWCSLQRAFTWKYITIGKKRQSQLWFQCDFKYSILLWIQYFCELFAWLRKNLLYVNILVSLIFSVMVSLIFSVIILQKSI